MDEAEEMDIFQCELGKGLEDSPVFRHFAFEWEYVEAEERGL